MNEIVTSAERLVPLIRKLRHTTENDRRIAEPIVRALRESDLCRMLLATGASPQYTPEEWLIVLETLAGAEASVSWLVWNNTLPCFWSRFLNDAGRERVFGDSGRLFAGSTRPTGRAVTTEGGSRLSGRWSLVSGCELADYLHLMSLVYEDGVPRMLAPGQPDLRVLFVPKGSYEILDTWHVGGLRGSGSHDVVVKDALVPRTHTLSPIDGSTLAGPLGRVPIVCTMAAGYAAQLLGLGQASVDALAALSKKKPAIDPGPALGERPAVFAAIAEHGVRLAAARNHLHDSVRRVWEASIAGPATPAQIAEVFNAAHHAMAQGRAAVTAMYALAGASALYTSSPLERIHRDMHAMAAHVISQPMWVEDTGRVLLGAKPMNPLYLV